MNSVYYQKYLKYKSKYDNLVTKIGGATVLDDTVVDENTAATTAVNVTGSKKYELMQKLDNDINEIKKQILTMNENIMKTESQVGQQEALFKSTRTKLLADNKTALELEKRQELLDIANVETELASAVHEKTRLEAELRADKEHLAATLHQMEIESKQLDTVTLNQIKNNIHKLQLLVHNYKDKKHAAEQLISKKNILLTKISTTHD